jgi:hypothetical protein
MPAKGQITASACVLFERPVAFSQLERALGKDYEIAKTVEEPATEWMFSGATLVVPYRPEARGYAVVDLVDHAWPDKPGDPVKEQMLFAAWGTGQFGPNAYAGDLKRAAEHSYAWERGKAAATEHSSFARVRTSYALGGAEEGLPLFPADYDPVAELRFVTDLTLKLMNLPQTFGYFNSNGEVLRGKAEAKEAVKFADEDGVPPLELWANVRLFTLVDGWLMMDTVGHPQLNAPGKPPFPDFEAVFPKGKCDPREVDAFFRNLALYLLANGADTIKDGDTIDGPGGAWQVAARKNGLMMPPRPTLRLCPAGETIPEPFGTMGNE